MTSRKKIDDAIRFLRDEGQHFKAGAVEEMKARAEAAERERDEANASADAVCDSYAAENQRLSDRAEKAVARIARLEEALRKISNESFGLEMRAIAREALKEPTP